MLTAAAVGEVVPVLEVLVGSDALGRVQSGSLRALGATAHTAGHHHQQRDQLAPSQQLVGVGQAAQLDHHLLAQLGDEELVLVVLAELSWVGEAVDPDIVVPRV
jgi:hypothetical protein